MSDPPTPSRGSVLVVSLWTIGFLASLAAAMAVQAEGQILAAKHVGGRIQAFHEAWGGVARGVAALKDGLREKDHQPLPPVLEGTGFRVSAEPGKVPLNAASAPVLAALITQVGVPEGSSAEEIAAAVVDWRDADDTLSPNGAESPYYEALSPPYPCRNANFGSVEELLLVRGVDSTLLTTLRPYVTVWGDKVNLNTAPAVVLQAIGISASGAEKLAAYTAGPDGKPGTKDDRQWTSVAACPAEAALSPEETATFSAASGWLTTTSTTYAIRAEGPVPGRPTPRVIECLVDSTTWKIVAWHET